MNTNNKIEQSVVPLNTLIRNRRSRRAYLDIPVEQEKINALFEAARWAPSANNEQPWVYVYATKEQPELWQAIFDSLNDGNKIWVEKSPLLIVAMVRKNFAANGNPNGSARYDLGAANAMLSVQAEAMSLNVHQMGGYNRQKVTENLQIPATHEPVVVIAVGYAGEPDLLPEPLKIREVAERTRYERDAFVMNTTF